ncbi:MAG: ABC transporter substrate-binding protein [Acidobacteria bacterium]|nr:ABC transporter substrate-binding protein [Acidobacteriota bacterium]
MTEIRVAHSPDSDDAFMFYALASGKLKTGDLKFTHILSDIETLNEKAMAGEYEVTAISFHAYAYLSDRYALLGHGASMGDRYGPVVVSGKPISLSRLKARTVAIPGKLTTAHLALRLLEPEVQVVVMPFDRIQDAVARGEIDAGLIIHEGQVTYADMGLHKVVDLGQWWHQETGLPLPLGGNAIRRDLPEETARRVSRMLKQSIEYALEHRDEALPYAMQFAREMTAQQADRFISMYVNDWTLGYGERGREAVSLLLRRAHEKGIIPTLPPIDFIE